MFDPRVDAFIEALAPWQQRICAAVRAVLHEADPELAETIKRTDRPYFVLAGNVAAFQATRSHVNVFVYDPIAADPGHVINQGHANATARSVQIGPDDEIDTDGLLALFGNVIANNRAGGWRTLPRG